jgi:hypothetical protein
LESNVLRDNPRLPFDPRHLDTDLLVWVRSDLGTIMNGATVSAWADFSGNTNDFAQATASAQPSLDRGGLGGRPQLFFDGSDDQIGGPDLYGTVSSNDDWTVVIVTGEGWTPGGAGSWYYHGQPAVWTTQPTGWAYAGFGIPSGTIARAGFYNGTAYKQADGPSSVAAGVALISAVVCDGGDLTLRINGDAGSTVASAGSIQSSATDLTLGKGSDNVSANWTWWDAGMSEFLIFDGALDEGEIEALESYLGDRYGIQV